MHESSASPVQQPAGPLEMAGAGVGVVVSGGLALLGQLSDSWAIGSAIGLLGVPAAAILGWRFGPRVAAASTGEVAWIVIQVGALASFGSALVVAGLFSIGALAGGNPLGLIIIAIALLYAIPALVLTIPAALVWALLIRLLTRYDR